MVEDTTVQGYKTKVGILEKKNEALTEQVTELTAPTSPLAESTKEVMRYVISYLLALGVAWLYQRYPVLGELQPDQATVVVFVTGLLIRGADKAWYHYQRNHGKVTKGIGLDLPLKTLTTLFEAQKGSVNGGNNIT